MSDVKDIQPNKFYFTQSFQGQHPKLIYVVKVSPKRITYNDVLGLGISIFFNWYNRGYLDNRRYFGGWATLEEAIPYLELIEYANTAKEHAIKAYQTEIKTILEQIGGGEDGGK